MSVFRGAEERGISSGCGKKSTCVYRSYRAQNKSNPAYFLEIVMDAHRQVVAAF